MIGSPEIRLEIQVGPTTIIPAAVWAGFQRAVYEAAHNYGLHVAIGQDMNRSLDAATQRFFDAQRLAQADDVGRNQDHT